MFISSDDDSIKNTLTSTIYSFGSSCDGIYGQMVFFPNGIIHGYVHPNECYWDLENGVLIFYDVNRVISASFDFSERLNTWIGISKGQKWPLFLVPVIKIDSPVNSGLSIFINSIPKSGTYFLEKVFTSLGMKSSGLHLSGRTTIHDNRGIDNIHFQPSNQYIRCDLSLLASLLADTNTITVGHIEYVDVVNKFSDSGIKVISVVRNLRDVLVSLMKFKEQKVKESSCAESLWKKQVGPNKLEAFLCYYHSLDIQHIKSVTAAIIEYETDVVKYEELVNGNFPLSVVNNYSQLSEIEEHLKRNLNVSTSTYSGQRSNFSDFWSIDMDKYFFDSGLYELNAKLGYEE